MSDENPTSNLSSSGAVFSDGDRIDMSALREFSVAEYDKEFGAPEAPAPEPAKQTKKVVAAPVEEYTEEEDTFEESEDEVAEEPDSEEELEASDENEEPETAEEDAESDEYIIARAKNGKGVKVSKEALVDLKVDGKIEQVTVQEAINRASGAIALDRKHTELGRERAALIKEREKFEEETQLTNDNLSALQEIAQNGTPEDFVQYYGALTGKDPGALLEKIISNAIDYAQRFSAMTDTERMLYNENRKYKFQQNLQKITQQRVAKKQAFDQERATVESALTSDGLSFKDFLEAAKDVRQQIEKGTLQGQYSALDIVEYAGWLKTDTSVKEGISSVNKALLGDVEFVNRVTRAIHKTQQADGERMSPVEIRKFVQRASDAQKKGISESLNKKVARHNKSGKTNSKIASSRNQENKSAEAVTLAEHREKLYGGF